MVAFREWYSAVRLLVARRVGRWAERVVWEAGGKALDAAPQVIHGLEQQHGGGEPAAGSADQWRAGGASGSEGPPPHWLAMLRERAPGLLVARRSVWETGGKAPDAALSVARGLEPQYGGGAPGARSGGPGGTGNASGSGEPPAHWLAMLRERAPGLVVGFGTAREAPQSEAAAGPGAGPGPKRASPAYEPVRRSRRATAEARGLDGGSASGRPEPDRWPTLLELPSPWDPKDLNPLWLADAERARARLRRLRREQFDVR